MSPHSLAFGFVLALVLGGSAHAEITVEVRGDVNCPSAPMVRAALDTICPDAEWPFDSVTVEVSNQRLSLTLDEDGDARREIPAAADCHERAETIALVVRAWSGELPARPTIPPALTVTSPAPDITPTHAFELDGEFLYSALWGRAPGAWLGVGRTPREGGLGLRAFGAYQSSQDVALAGGQNRLRRLLVGIAPTLHLQREALFASTDVGLLATFTRAKGEGYDNDQRAEAWNLGGVADLRAGLQLDKIRIWLGARVLRLFHQETITIASTPGNSDTSCLHAWDVQLGLGMGTRFE